MPVIPQPNSNGIVRSLGFAFDFAEAFTSACVEQGVESVEAYATLAATVATQFTANGVGAVGTSSDVQAPNTSLWALSKEAIADALTAASNSSVALESANIAITTADGALEVANGAQTSLGTSTDLYPAQQTAWGRANQAYAEGGGGGLPAGTVPGSWLSYNGTDWIEGGGSGNIKLGYNAGLAGQEEICVAIGEDAGRTGQMAGAIAIGFSAGKTNQGLNSIAIGANTGETNQPANTIILNASGAPLNAAQAGGMYVNPIRNVVGNPNWLTYNSMSGEITFDSLLATSLGSSNDTASLTTSVWAYAKQAESVANSNLSTLNTQFTPSGVGAVGTSTDIDAPNTSLWALSKQAWADAQTAATNANVAFENAATALETANAAQTTANANLSTLNTQFTANGSNVVGTSGDTLSQSTSLWALAKYISAQLPRYEYGSAFTTTALTSNYIEFNNITLTTNTPSCPILAWASIDISNGTGGGDCIVQSRIAITPAGQAAQYGSVRQMTITTNHRQNMACMARGTGFSTPGNVEIKVECRVISGTANFNLSQITAVANPIQA